MRVELEDRACSEIIYIERERERDKIGATFCMRKALSVTDTQAE